MELEKEKRKTEVLKVNLQYRPLYYKIETI